MHESSIVEPVFIFSLPRSGSTLLQRMLACHKEISTKSELWFLLPHVEALKNEYTRTQYSSDTLKKATGGLLSMLPNGEEDYFKAIRALADNIYSDLREPGCRYILDKTPRYYLIVDEIAKIYPNAKFIFLFRNPMSVSASLVESFYNNRMGDYHHRIDMYEGAKYLAKAYQSNKNRSVAIKYEDLIDDPEEKLRIICTYLELEYDGTMLENFTQVPFAGLGDTYGSRRFTKVTGESKEKWRKVFNTTYRRKCLVRMLRYIGKDAIEISGYKYDDLLSEASSYAVQFSMSLRDRVDMLICGVYSFIDFPFLKKKIKSQKPGKKFYIYQ